MVAVYGQWFCSTQRKLYSCVRNHCIFHGNLVPQKGLDMGPLRRCYGHTKDGVETSPYISNWICITLHWTISDTCILVLLLTFWPHIYLFHAIESNFVLNFIDFSEFTLRNFIFQYSPITSHHSPAVLLNPILGSNLNMCCITSKLVFPSFLICCYYLIFWICHECIGTGLIYCIQLHHLLQA